MLVTTIKKDFMAVNVVMITSIDLPQEISAINLLTTLKSSLERCCKYALRSLRLYEGWVSLYNVKNMFTNM